MTSAAVAASGKGHEDENFPVASWLVGATYRQPILAFYRFARAADDVADHPSLAPEQKLALLDRLGDTLSGRGAGDPDAEPLRRVLAERGLSPRHAFDLLEAFRLDVSKRRYASWDELMDYCRLSAAPVGRFVLDLHGEDRAAWRASDPLCAALQVINHLQDCAADYRRLDRVYLPEATLAQHGAGVEMLAAARSAPPLLAAVHDLAGRTAALVADAAPLAGQTANPRLALEIAAIQALAGTLVRRISTRDPLADDVHLGKAAAAIVAGRGVLGGCWSLLTKALRRPGQSAHE
ncbi:squalene synthase HpnC [Roseiarcus fermentans]|uniref:Squalene synthase HpnC n=1 Tax=Roseiarcus fermentans TaxID=1473586 RepID=A0A366FC26_9HYPH|nr:squalene synthase HpnC [Roseiarcus fermentans]RBP12191.1 squalene synthase HpnC [Roseiarcus fermentans]